MTFLCTRCPYYTSGSTKIYLPSGSAGCIHSVTAASASRGQKLNRHRISKTSCLRPNPLISLIDYIFMWKAVTIQYLLPAVVSKTITLSSSNTNTCSAANYVVISLVTSTRGRWRHDDVRKTSRRRRPYPVTTDPVKGVLIGRSLKGRPPPRHLYRG